MSIRVCNLWICSSVCVLFKIKRLRQQNLHGSAETIVCNLLIAGTSFDYFNREELLISVCRGELSRRTNKHVIINIDTDILTYTYRGTYAHTHGTT